MLTVDALSIGYKKKIISSNLNLSVESGEMWSLVGANGVGKSTLLKTLMGFVRSFSGTINNSFKKTSYLPQKHSLDKTFPLTVIDVVNMGSWGLNICENEIKKTLEKVNLLNIKNNPISTLSGGQWQRMLFARLIIEDADLILLDEPFDGIDQITQKIIVSLLKSWESSGKSIICVTHDFPFVKKHFKNTMIINNKGILCGETQDILNEKTIMGTMYSV